MGNPGAAKGSLPHFERGIAESKSFVIEIAVLSQSCNYFFNSLFRSAFSFQQPFAKLGDRAGFGGQEFDGTLEGARSDFFWCERGYRVIMGRLPASSLTAHGEYLTTEP